MKGPLTVPKESSTSTGIHLADCFLLASVSRPAKCALLPYLAAQSWGAGSDAGVLEI